MPKTEREKLTKTTDGHLVIKTARGAVNKNY